MNRFPSHDLILKGAGILERSVGGEGDASERPAAGPAAPQKGPGGLDHPRHQPLPKTHSASIVITPPPSL